MWLPMTITKSSLLVRWRLGWLPNRKTGPCHYGFRNMIRKHISLCLFLHLRLHVPYRIDNPIFYILNKLPRKRPPSTLTKQYWHYVWPTLIPLLLIIDDIHYQGNAPLLKIQPPTSSSFLKWMKDEYHFFSFSSYIFIACFIKETFSPFSPIKPIVLIWAIKVISHCVLN
ncbi:hypothetical protein BD560DRAFT_469555 [Blakeslea trispora]|nr:hypothetical protein BD560DRAFT_469555 [Blakeslea trispora]